MVIFWDENSPGVSQSTAFVDAGGELAITTFSTAGLPELSTFPAFGVTDTCEYLSLFSAECTEASSSTKKHDFDYANGEKRLENDCVTLTSFKSVHKALEYYLGDIRVEPSDPVVDSIEVFSDSLYYIALSIEMSPLEELFYEAILFSSDFITVKLQKSGTKTKRANGNQDVQYSYRLVFDFASPQRLSFAVDCWVLSIWNLLSILCGGPMAVKDHVVHSKKLGGSFRCGYVPSIQIEGKRPKIDSVEFSLGKLHPINYQKMISAWMERPSTLRGMASEFLATRYGDLYAHSKLLASMRGVESAFADNVLNMLIIEKNTENNASGLYDIESRSYRYVKKSLDDLQRSPYFAVKLTSLINRFGRLFSESSNNGIDWNAFVKHAKNLRNAKAHGTFIGGIPLE